MVGQEVSERTGRFWKRHLNHYAPQLMKLGDFKYNRNPKPTVKETTGEAVQVQIPPYLAT